MRLLKQVIFIKVIPFLVTGLKSFHCPTFPLSIKIKTALCHDFYNKNFKKQKQIK